MNISNRWLLWTLLGAGLAAAGVPGDYQGKPYTSAQAIPGRIECANYDRGGEGVAYHDVDPVNHGSGELNYQAGHCEAGVPASICHFREDEGVDISYTKQMADFKHPNYYSPEKRQLYIGWEADGEWTNYTVDVRAAGSYRIVALYSKAPNTVRFSVNGKPAAECRLPMDTGDWHIWNKAECGEIVFPEKGTQLLTLHYSSGNNLAYFDFIPAGESAGASGWKMNGFIARRGGELYEGDAPFRFLGLDAADLFQNEAQLLPDFSNRFPDEFELRDSLETLRQMGARVTRTFTLTVQSPRDQAPAFLLGPGRYNEAAFRSLDLLLALCHEYDVRLIVPFLAAQSFKNVRGVDEFAAFLGKPVESFFTDPEVGEAYHELIRYVLNRRNTVSGLLYKDDPAILAWQAANEPMTYFPDRGKPQNERLITDWTLATARFIKSIDSRHLVIASGGTAARFVASEDIDILSGHYYQYWDKLGGGSGDIAAMMLRDEADIQGKRPLIADEFGLADTPLLRRFMDTLIGRRVSGGLLWGLRAHRRDGGFYYHNESGTDVNSYHWPGFAAGAGYDEQAVLALLRDRAFRIRGMAAPEVKPPEFPPVMLPVSPLRELRWRGCTGASGYDIERAPTIEGPWTAVAENVSDAVVDSGEVVGYENQWEASQPASAPPLWRDTTVKGAGPFFYRVAGRNAAGRSPWSNVVEFQ